MAARVDNYAPVAEIGYYALGEMKRVPVTPTPTVGGGDPRWLQRQMLLREQYAIDEDELIILLGMMELL